jgi:DNA-binding PadR family transcriptional regulator
VVSGIIEGLPRFALLAVGLTVDGVISIAYCTEYDTKQSNTMSVRHALLALLSEGPKYGLQLGQEFEARTGEVWPLNMGQVYTTLQRLERDGLVESDDAGEDGPQKGFRITDAGRDELRVWLRTPPDTSVPPRDELVIKVLIAMRLPGVDVLEIVQAHRRHLVETMHYYTRLKEDAGEHEVGLLLVADAEIFRLDAFIRWLDAAEARIKRLPAAAEVPAAPAWPRRRRKVGARR